VDADNLPYRDYSLLKKKYVVDFSTTRDKQGRAGDKNNFMIDLYLKVDLGFLVLLMPLGDWDIRNKAIEGKLTDLLTHMDNIQETGAQLSYNLTGDPTAYLIVDYAGFNLRQHACARCKIYLCFRSSSCINSNSNSYEFFRHILLHELDS